jgi:hypothetical protein
MQQQHTSLAGAAPFRLVAVALAAAFFFAPPLATPARAEHAVWKSHPNHLSVIAGVTDDEEATAFTLGLDYEYRVSELLGLGAVVEHAFEDIDATTLLVVADIHIWRGLAIQTGPGVEFADGKEEETAEEARAREEEAARDEDFFIYRLGALYEFEFGRTTLSPQLHYDFSSGPDAVVACLALGYSF